MTSSFVYPQSRSPPHRSRRSTSPILLSRRPTACNECDVLWVAAQTIQRWKELPEPTFLILASVGLLVLQHLLTIRSTGSIRRTVEDIADDLASDAKRLRSKRDSLTVCLLPLHSSPIVVPGFRFGDSLYAKSYGLLGARTATVP